MSGNLSQCYTIQTISLSQQKYTQWKLKKARKQAETSLSPLLLSVKDAEHEWSLIFLEVREDNTTLYDNNHTIAFSNTRKIVFFVVSCFVFLPSHPPENAWLPSFLLSRFIVSSQQIPQLCSGFPYLQKSTHGPVYHLFSEYAILSKNISWQITNPDESLISTVTQICPFYVEECFVQIFFLVSLIPEEWVPPIQCPEDSEQVECLWPRLWGECQQWMLRSHTVTQSCQSEQDNAACPAVYFMSSM